MYEARLGELVCAHLLVLLPVVCTENLVVDLVISLIFDYIHEFHEICCNPILQLAGFAWLSDQWDRLAARYTANRSAISHHADSAARFKGGRWGVHDAATVTRNEALIMIAIGVHLSWRGRATLGSRH